MRKDTRQAGYVNTRDFAGDVEVGTAGDVGPEGVLFIGAPGKRRASTWQALCRYLITIRTGPGDKETR
ncbi:hypothetical protein ACTWPT_12365 [Nonomuraea sp. 3N208]|uniref:hypothetical protein n=1 Tax=Nonomuraea sp. 3N208 TaxID=3457421 RepID=UPI003FCDEB19